MTGYFLSKNKYNENSIIAEIFTENHGKVLELYLEELQKKLKIIYKLEIKCMLIIHSKNKVKLDILK